MKHRLFIVAQALVLLLFVTAVAVGAQADRPDAPTNHFTDVQPGFTFYDSIENISDADIASGYTDVGTCGVGNTPCYKPFNNVTRGQMARFVDNTRKRPGIAILTTPGQPTSWDNLPLSSKTHTNDGTAIYGAHTNTSGAAPAIIGESASSAFGAIGVHGVISTTGSGPGAAGVRGTNRGTGPFGIGVAGTHAGTGFGVLGTATGAGTGVWASAGGNGEGVHSTGGDNGRGVYASAGAQGEGVRGESENGVGVIGVHTNGTPSSRPGVLGETNSTLAGVGVHGFARGLSYGVIGESTYIGVYGTVSTTTGIAYGVYGRATGASQEAGHFEGDVQVTGTCACLFSTYEIDHPLDPANKTLSHGAVASPDRMNIYNGNITTNAQGEAVVQLPEYFGALNRDFRYQLTPLGQFAQAIVATEITDNKFTIKTDKPNVKVSWQVTGVRNDRVANSRLITVEKDKPAEQKGLYLNPQLYGQPATKSIYKTPELEKYSTEYTPAKTQLDEMQQ